jgi:hypothetical protein
MTISRVLYRERQRLTAADLRAEQDYRLALGGRHHVTHHEWGVVRGLRVIGNTQGGFTLTRGVAIDGYGRELVVSQPVDLEIDGLDRCWFVHVAYCEDPEQVPPGRQCRDDPAPRIGPRVAVVVSSRSVAPPAADAGPASARAAGAGSAWRPWPVLVAAVGIGCRGEEDPNASLVDYARVRYVRHRAGVIRSPNGRARLQLGLASLVDVYHFLLSTGDAAGTLAHRVGIDRDGVTHVWQQLVVSGAEVVGQIALAQNRLMQITAPKPGGVGARLRVNGSIDLANSVVSASLLRLGNPTTGQSAMKGVATVKAYKAVTEVPILAGRIALGTISLFDRIRSVPVPFPRPPRRAKAGGLEQAQISEPLEQPFSGELRPAGGELWLRSLQRTKERTAAACGDVARTRADAGDAGTPVVQFRPAIEITGDPLAREIHAVTTSKPTDVVPRTELRISGGAFDESDASSRLSIGSWLPPVDDAPLEWIPAFRMDGGRRLEILVPAGQPQTDAVLEVDDTVYLPPIGKKDPLLPDLMAMAFIAGLRQIGRVTLPDNPDLILDIDDVAPNPIVRGESWTYRLQATWGAVDEVNRCLEVITGIEGNGDMAFRTLTGVTKQSTTFDVTVPDFWHRASRVRLEIQLLVTTSDVKRVASVSVEVPVTS